MRKVPVYLTLAYKVSECGDSRKCGTLTGMFGISLDMDFHKLNAELSFGRIEAACQIGGNNDRLSVTGEYEYGWHSTIGSTCMSKCKCYKI